MNKPMCFALFLLLGRMPFVQASELGRLFFTRDERGQLEQEYTRQTDAGGESERSWLTVNGLIQRGDGSRIVWINGKAQKTGANDNPGIVLVTIAGKNKAVEVKVGQRIVPDDSMSTRLDTEGASKDRK